MLNRAGFPSFNLRTAASRPIAQILALLALIVLLTGCFYHPGYSVAYGGYGYYGGGGGGHHGDYWRRGNRGYGHYPYYGGRHRGYGHHGSYHGHGYGYGHGHGRWR